MSQSQRPGIYSSYEITVSGRAATGARAAGVVALAPGVPGGEVHTVTSISQAISLLGADTPLSLAVQALILSGVAKVYAVAAAQPGAQAYEQALSLLREIPDIAAVVCDCTDEACAAKLREHVTEASQERRERIGVLGAGEVSLAAEMAQSLNSERMMVVTPAARLAPQGQALPVIAAATMAGAILTQEDPSYNFSGMILSVLHSLAGKHSEEQVNTLIVSGVTVLEDSFGVIECIRAMSTRTETQGVPDRSFSSINTALIIDYVLRALRDSLKLRLKGAKNNRFTLEGIASQTVVVLSELTDAGILSAYTAPRVYTDTQDSSVCVVEVGFTVSHVINQIHLKAHIQI